MSINLSNLFNTDENVYYFEDEVANSDINSDLKDFEILHPIKYKGEICKINREYIINIHTYYTFKANCDRCLSSTLKEMKSSLSAKLEDYKEVQNDDKDNEVNEDDEQEDVVYYDNNLLDIEKYVLMEVLSSLPMKTLCKNECKGLCPQCGIDLNEKSCDCVVDNTDPRLEKLKDFFEKK